MHCDKKEIYMTTYYVDVLNFNANNSVFSNCADITFFNAGTSNVLLNKALPIFPGGSITFSANNDELDKTIYNFAFTTAGFNNFIVIRKIYTK